MKGALAIIAAGGSFAATVIVAGIIGWLLDERLHRSDLVVYAFFAGVLLGGYTAFRMVADTIRSS